jgi:DNA replication and repair protein RecF
VLAVGPNGAGKTNLLEALHVGTQGFSPRTRVDAQLVRFGQSAARLELRGERGGVPLELQVTLRLGEGKRASVNGSALSAAEQLRSQVTTLVFTPDRLAVVKGPPAARRAYFDRVVGRLTPARAALSADYGAALAQRNASLRRVSGGFSSPDALAPWTERVAELGARLVEARTQVLGELAPRFAERAAELGLPDGRLEYAGEPPTVEALEGRLGRNLERGVTGLGPHLDDVTIASAARELRAFGSQGEQRLAVLSLLLAEHELLAARGQTPLFLLDDVLSELDERRRRLLAERIRHGGQTFVTATSADSLPAAPDQLIEVTPGAARVA